MDHLEFLDGDHADDAPAPTAQPQAQAEPAPSSETPATGPARGPDGKFVATPTTAPAEPAQQPAGAAPASPPAPEPGHVPISAMLDEREKRQTLERQLADLQRQVQAQTPAPKAPDRFADPDGYERFQQEQADERLYGLRVEMSERFAVSQYGEDTVQKAVEWGFSRCASDPHFNAQVRASPDPIAFTVQQFQKDQVFAKVGDKFDPTQFDAFLAWQAQQAAAPAQQPQTQQAAAPAAPATPAVKPPPRSLVHAPQAGGAAGGAVSPEDGFAAAIP